MLFILKAALIQEPHPYHFGLFIVTVSCLCLTLLSGYTDATSSEQCAATRYLPEVAMPQYNKSIGVCTLFKCRLLDSNAKNHKVSHMLETCLWMYPSKNCKSQS